MELPLVTSRKNASIFPAGVYEISILPPLFPTNAHACGRFLGEDGTSRSKRHTIITNFKEELSLYYIEPFILIWMNMTRRAALLAGSVLDDEQLTICVSS